MTAAGMTSHEHRIAFLGSGAFGIPSAESLHRDYGVALVISQPDRPAGRGRQETPTPVAAWAEGKGIECGRTDDVNGEQLRELLAARAIDTLVIIAFGQKIGPDVLRGRFAVNLHGSLLPRWRGAAPIQRAVMAGDEVVGVSVISIAERMDAGLIYDSASTRVGESETAGELHDRLAVLGVEPLMRVVRQHMAGVALAGTAQDESAATRARKLSRDDAWVDFGQPPRLVAARINGLSPWPGIDAEVEGKPLKILRARAVEVGAMGEKLELLEVQPPGKRAMPWMDYVRGMRFDAACMGREPHLSCPGAHHA